MARMEHHGKRKQSMGAPALSSSGRILHWLGMIAMIVSLFAPLFTLDTATAAPMTPDRAKLMAMQQPLDRDIGQFDRVVLVGDFQAQLGCADWDPNCAATVLNGTNAFYTGAFQVPAGNWNWELIGVDVNGTQYSLDTGQVTVNEGQAGIYADFNAPARESNVQAMDIRASINGPFGTFPLKPENGGFVAPSVSATADGPVDFQVTVSTLDQGDISVPGNANLSQGVNKLTFDGQGNLTNTESLGNAQVTVQRLDADGNPLPGSCYVLEGSSTSRGCDLDDGNADGNTTLRFPGQFQPGSFNLRETTPADGQKPAADQQIDVQPGGSTVQVQSEGAATGDIVVLRQDIDGNPVGGACVEAVDANGEVVSSACDEDGDVPDDGRIGIFGLPEGPITLIESRTPTGYELAADTAATVTADQSTDVPMQSAALIQQGNLIVTRTNSDGAPVVGASYALIDVNGNIAAEATDDGTGTTTFSGVNAGDYTLRETTTPEGNEAGADQPVTVTANQDTPVTVSAAAIPQTGDVIVTRTNSDGAPVVGASYALIDANGNVVAEATDDGSGTTTFSGVNAGTYTLREKTTPEGNEAGADQPVTVTANQDTPVTVSAAAIPQTGNVIVTRTNADGAPVVGASYALIDANGIIAAEAADDGSGTTTFSGVNAGSYTLRETTTPEGNEAGADQPVTVTANQDTPVTVSAAAIPQTGNVIVTRTNIDGAPVDGASYALIDANGNIAAEATDDGTGTTTFSGVNAGSYTLRETTTPEGNEAGADQPVTVTANQDTPVTVSAAVIIPPTEVPTETVIPTETATETVAPTETEVPPATETETPTEVVLQPGNLVITRTDSDGAPVGGACFAVVDAEGTVLGEQCDEDGFAPDDGTTGIYDIPEGTYTLRETRTPDGHQTPADTEVTIQPGIDNAVTVAAPVAAAPTETATETPTETVVPTETETPTETVVPTEVGTETETPTEAPTEVVPPPATGSAIVVTYEFVEGQPQACIELGTGATIIQSDLPFGCDNADNDTDPAAGVIRLDGVPAGEYQVYFYAGPDNLVQAEPRAVTLTDGQATTETYAPEAPATTSFTIATNDGGVAIGGACYLVEGVGEFCDDGSGTVTVSDVAPGSYSISMSGTPEGYETAAPQTVEVAADGSTAVVFTVAKVTASLVIYTTDGTNSVPGACYQVDGINEPTCDDGSGTTTVTNVTLGDHTVAMTTVPEGYDAPQPQSITVVAGSGNEATFTLVPTTQNLSITTLDTVSGEPVPGACYAIDGAEQVCDDTASGQVVIEGVEPTEHAVSMTEAPAGFEPAADQTVPAGVTTLDVEVQALSGTINVTVLDEAGAAYPNACIAHPVTTNPICDDDGDGVITIADLGANTYSIALTTGIDGYQVPAAQDAVITAEGNTVDLTFNLTLANTSFVITTTDGTNPVGGACFLIDDATEPVCADDSGSLTVSDVAPGPHTVTMTTAPGGFELPEPAGQDVTVAADGTTQVAFQVVNAPISLEITTVDSETTQPVVGACYTVDGTEICDTAESGTVTAPNLDPAVAHQVEMTTAPAGYQTAAAQEVPAGTTTLQVVISLEFGDLSVNVTDENAAPIGSACVSLATGETGCDDDNDGRIDFTGLAVGENTVTLTSVPAGYDVPTDPEAVTIVANQPATAGFQLVPTPPTTGGLDVSVLYSDQAIVEGACVTVTLSGGATQVGICDGDENDSNPEPGIVGFDNLPAGTYEVAMTPGSETARPLQTTTPVSATVVGGERAAVTLTLPLAPETGNLQIVTTADGSNVGGACFTVNDQVVCDNQSGDGDGTAGVVLLNDLEPGDYQVTMSTVPDGYEEPAAQQFTLVAGDTARLDFELTRIAQPGSVVVNTQNGDGDPLNNACYALMQNGTRVGSQCDGTPADGSVTFADVPAGTYQLVQTQTPGGQYSAAPAQNVEVRAGEETVVDVVMDLRPGRLTVVTADRNEPTLLLQNACYTLVGATEFGPFCDADDGNVDGRVVFTNVPAGEYELRQTVASAGYEAAGNRTVKIQAGGSLQITVLNDMVAPPAENGTLVVVPQDPTGNAVAGGCYQVFNGDVPVTQRICDNADDQNGRITFAELPVGEFELREMLAPSPDWQLADPITVTIANGETTTVEVPHEYKPGNVVIQAVNSVGLPLQGACFTLTDAGDTQLCTDSAGQATISDLTPGARQLTQTTAPFGFKLNETPREVTVRPGQTTTVRVTFENAPPPNTGTVQIQKFVCPANEDRGEWTQFLGGAQGNNQLKQTAGCVPAIASFTLVAEDGSTESNAQFSTNEDGRAQLTAVNGIYLLTETDPDLPGNSAARIRVGTGQMTTVIVINYVAPPKPAPVTINVEGYTCAPGFSGSTFVDFQNSCMANTQLTNQVTVRAESQTQRFKQVTGDTGVLGKTTFTDLPAGTYTVWAERPFNMPLSYLFCGPDPASPTLKSVNGSVVTTQQSGTEITCRVFQVPPLFDATHGAVQVQKYNCPIDERQRGYDYQGECERAAEPVPFQLQRVDPATKNKTPIGDPIQVSTNADGIVQFPMLVPGTYRLTEVEGEWCFAQSNSVDSQGDVIVTQNKLSEVWIYNCVGTGTPPNTGSGDAAELINPDHDYGPAQIMPNLIWPTILLAGWMIRRQRHQA